MTCTVESPCVVVLDAPASVSSFMQAFELEALLAVALIALALGVIVGRALFGGSGG